MALLGVTMAHRTKTGFFGMTMRVLGHVRQPWGLKLISKVSSSVPSCDYHMYFGCQEHIFGVLGHFQVIKGQKPAFLGHFWGMGSLWQWITLDWNVVSKKSDRIWNRDGKISVWRKNEPILLIRSASKIEMKKKYQIPCFYEGEIGHFWPI